jgi:hypothetical protein
MKQAGKLPLDVCTRADGKQNDRQECLKVEQG